MISREAGKGYGCGGWEIGSEMANMPQSPEIVIKHIKSTHILHCEFVCCVFPHLLLTGFPEFPSFLTRS
jgi:hypothetical protein